MAIISRSTAASTTTVGINPVTVVNLTTTISLHMADKDMVIAARRVASNTVASNTAVNNTATAVVTDTTLTTSTAVANLSMAAAAAAVTRAKARVRAMAAVVAIKRRNQLRGIPASFCLLLAS